MSYFTLNRPLGQLSLLVAISLCVFVSLSLPLLSPLNKIPITQLKGITWLKFYFCAQFIYTIPGIAVPSWLYEVSVMALG